MTMTWSNPGRDCSLCPRLVAFREDLRLKEPDWHNAPVPSFGDLSAQLLVVGLAPGMKGANRTGRPFTGDYAGDLLYETLARHSFSTGRYDREPSDGMTLQDCRIANAVRCLPPQNKPTPLEAKTCRPFLVDEIAAMPNLKGILTLGRVSHEAILRTLGTRLADAPFRHGALHEIGSLFVADSYHCSRYNTNTRRLTSEMFDAVIATVRQQLNAG
ncbi:MAG: uracil-DNA glycosylase [Alphaproteobacteria bacterium]